MKFFVEAIGTNGMSRSLSVQSDDDIIPSDLVDQFRGVTTAIISVDFQVSNRQAFKTVMQALGTIGEYLVG